MLSPAHIKGLSKTFAICACVLVTSVAYGLSLTENSHATSTNNHALMHLPAAKAAPKKLPSIKSVATNTKQKRAAPVPYLASATPYAAPAMSPLLAVVRQPDINAHHQELANKVLLALPAQCRTYLKNFYVSYDENAERGLGGATTIRIKGTESDTEFVGLLVHECGHVTHGNMLGNPKSAASTFKDGKDVFYTESSAASFYSISWTTETVMKRGVANNDFVSGYAKSDAFEDFAESFAMYILHRPAMRERAKTNSAIASKLAWMETNLPADENALSMDQYTWNKQVPWDVTKLAFILQ